MKKGRSKLMRLAAFSASIMMYASLSGCGLTVTRSDRDKVIGSKMVVIGQAMNIQFWDYVKLGAEEAGEELEYDVEYVSARDTNDIEGQVTLVNDAVKNGAKAIVIAPNSGTDEGLKQALKSAKDQGIAVITIDADFSDPDEGEDGLKADDVRLLYIGSINQSAAQIAAKHALEYLNDSKHYANGKPGKIGIIGHSATSSACEDRINPFKGAVINAFSGSSGSAAQQGGAPTGEGQQGGAPTGEGQQGGAPTGEGQQGGAPTGAGQQGGPPEWMKHLVNNGEISYCAGESEKAKTIAAQMINENPDLRVLYATNERSTIGVCEAVKEAKEEGRISKEKENLIMVIGFNANSTEVDFIQNDILTGTILQNPYNMGYLGVMNAGNYLSDGSAHGKVDTGVVYVNKGNLNNNDVRLLLDPQNYIKNYIKD